MKKKKFICLFFFPQNVYFKLQLSCDLFRFMFLYQFKFIICILYINICLYIIRGRCIGTHGCKCTHAFFMENGLTGTCRQLIR